MKQLPRLKPKNGPMPPLRCINREEIIRAFAEMRQHRGMSQIEFDDWAGFPIGYTGKLEAAAAPAGPNRRKSGRFAFPPAFDHWLAGLGVALVVVPANEDADLAGARQPDTSPPAMTFKRAQRMRALHAGGKGRPVNSLYRLFQCSPRLAADILADRAFAAPTWPIAAE